MERNLETASLDTGSRKRDEHLRSGGTSSMQTGTPIWCVSLDRRSSA